jgi:hypothetical protein
MKTPTDLQTCSDVVNIITTVTAFKAQADIEHISLFRTPAGDALWETDFDKSYDRICDIDAPLEFLDALTGDVDTAAFVDSAVIGTKIFDTGEVGDTHIVLTTELIETPCWDLTGLTQSKSGLVDIPEITVEVVVLEDAQKLSLQRRATIDPELVASGIDGDIDEIIAGLMGDLEEQERLCCEMYESLCETYQAFIASRMTRDAETGDMRRSVMDHRLRRSAG